MDYLSFTVKHIKYGTNVQMLVVC